MLQVPFFTTKLRSFGWLGHSPRHRSPVEFFVLIVLVCGLGPPARAQDTTQVAAAAPAAPCQGSEYRQFDFWIGDWEVKSLQGAELGVNRIEAILNGCVLVENWQGAGGGVGKSFNMYYARENAWRQTWVDDQGGRLDLAGGLQNKDMVLSGETLTRAGGRALQEVRWTPLEDGSVRQHWRVSTDGGKTWQDAFDGIYRRKK